jgi:hypothetical protein
MLELNTQEETAEDWNLNEICIRKAIKCHRLNPTVHVLGIMVRDGKT